MAPPAHLDSLAASMWNSLAKAAHSIMVFLTGRPSPTSPPADPPEFPPPRDPAPGPDPLILLDSTTHFVSTLNLQTRTRNLLVSTLLSPHLPPELILQILDHAHSHLCLPPTYLPRQNPPLRITDVRKYPGPTRSLGDKIILSTPPLTRATIRRARKITLTWLSKDQGWSSYPAEHGTYDGSWTWFDCALQPSTPLPPSPLPTAADADPRAEDAAPPLHLDPSLVDGVPLKTRYRLQHNRHAGREMELYRIELERGEERGEGHAIFEEMEEGDRVVLVGSARFAGWMNLVEAASLLVWVVDDLRGSVVEAEGGESGVIGWGGEGGLVSE